MNQMFVAVSVVPKPNESSFLAMMMENNPMLASIFFCVAGSVAVGAVTTLLSFYFSDPFTTTWQALLTNIFFSFGVGGAVGVVVLLMTGDWFPETSLRFLLVLVASGIVANLVVSVGLLFFLSWAHAVLSTRFDLARTSSGLFRWLPVKNELMQRLR